MKKTTLVGLISLIIGASFVFFIYKNIYMVSADVIGLISGLNVIAYFLTKKLTGETNKRADKMIIVSFSVYLCLFLSSILYSTWTLESFVSKTVITKTVLFLLLLGAIYLDLVYIRAEYSYKKKIGNQRIQTTMKKGYFEKKKDERERKTRKEVCIILGQSTENE